jgi:hypothetical protein
MVARKAESGMTLSELVIPLSEFREILPLRMTTLFNMSWVMLELITPFATGVCFVVLASRGRAQMSR